MLTPTLMLIIKWSIFSRGSKTVKDAELILSSVINDQKMFLMPKPKFGYYPIFRRKL